MQHAEEEQQIYGPTAAGLLSEPRLPQSQSAVMLVG